jgi:uncharacterized protein (TIGR03545 family)
MTRFRWQTWVPRALAVGVLLLAAQYILGLAVRTAAIDSATTAVGTPIEIGSSRVSLADRKVILNDLTVHDPRSPAVKLLEADRCEIELATDALLRKRIVATRGQVSGLRFNAFAGDESTPNAEAAEAASSIRWIGDDSEAVALHWIAQLAGQFADHRIDQLKSVERTEAFCENWSRTSAALETRGHELNNRVAALQTALKAAEANPLRGGKVVAELPQTIASLEREFAALNADLAKLPDELDQERRAIVADRRADEDLVRERTTLKTVEANALSTYLLRRQASQPLGELLSWLRWLREPALAPRAKARGEDLIFAGCSTAPNVLLHALDVRGSARVAGQPVDLRGQLTGLSNAPASSADPIRLRLTGTGSMPLEMQVTIDRTRGANRDTFLADCQGVLWQQLTLGRPDQLAVTIGPSLGSLSVSVAVDGESLTGEIQMVQQSVRITPALAGDFGDAPLATSLSDTLSRIDSLATRASLGGTLRQPTCTLWSNLGPAVAEAVERSLEKATRQHARATLAKADQQINEQLTTAEQQMAELQTRWSTGYADARAKLSTIAATDAVRNRLSPTRLGHRVPANSLFR